MKKIGSAFENFAFKAFDFSGRATLLEYWLMMPLVWAVILFLTWGDLVEMWGMLLQRQVPPINPLYWDGLLVFLITIIPRLSLTVRRLHDSGKSGRWAKLPFVTVISGVVLVLGTFSAIATSNAVSSGFGAELSMFAIVIAIMMGSADTAWDAIFATARVLNATGWDPIIAMLADLTTPSEQSRINLSKGTSNLASEFQNDPSLTAAMLLPMILMICTPFVAGFLHLFFMISPTKPDHELSTSGPIAGASLRRKGEVSDNPFAGYKYLYAKTPEQEAAHKAAAKEEIKSLYQQRVLGQETG